MFAYLMVSLAISTIDIILTRMMHEALFADAVFENAELALVEYNLLPEEIERFKSITRAGFVSMTLEERKAFAAWVMHPNDAYPLKQCDKDINTL